jgi:hypothetical protein
MLSRQDAGTGALLMTKERWSMPPAPMAEVPIDIHRARIETRIVPEDCACVPRPQRHLHLELGHVRGRLDFGAGAVVEAAPHGDGFVLRNG